MQIKILHQYHNNMFDTVKALEREHEVEFLSYRRSQLVPGIRNRQPTVKRLGVKFYAPRHLSTLLGNNTDVLIVKHLNDPINLVPYLLCWLKGIRCVVLTQRPVHLSFPGYHVLLAALKRMLRAMAVSILATNKESYHELARDFKRITYIPACIDPKHWAIQPAYHRQPRPDELHLLTVAKYQPRKHIPLLIIALAALRKQFPGIRLHLTVVGDLTEREESQQEFQRVKATIRHHALERHVTLFQNAPYEHMPQHYARADLFILAAASEPLGYAVVEAMATQKPVICSDETGAASYIEPDKNGYICRTGSKEALRAAIASFITTAGTVDTEKIRAFGTYSRTLIERNHTPEVFLQRFAALLY